MCININLISPFLPGVYFKWQNHRAEKQHRSWLSAQNLPTNLGSCCWLKIQLKPRRKLHPASEHNRRLFKLHSLVQMMFKQEKNTSFRRKSEESEGRKSETRQNVKQRKRSNFTCSVCVMSGRVLSGGWLLVHSQRHLHNSQITSLNTRSASEWSQHSAETRVLVLVLCPLCSVTFMT